MKLTPSMKFLLLDVLDGDPIVIYQSTLDSLCRRGLLTPERALTDKGKEIAIALKAELDKLHLPRNQWREFFDRGQP